MSTADLTLQTTADSHVTAVIERLELGTPEEIDPAIGPQPPHRIPRRTAQQSQTLPTITQRVRRWRRLDGFRGAVVLASRDHNRITVYSRFDSDSDTGTAPRILDTDDALGIPARTLDLRTYDLAWRAGNESPTTVSLPHTPVVHFGLFTVLDDQADALLEKITAHAPASLVTPGLRTINFHVSHDRQRLVNVGTWSGFDRFHVLLDQPGFTNGGKYFDGLATFENDYFDVVDIVSEPVAAAHSRR
ncbi:hypothetical protein [Catenuloplanes japonicus]|uniref:hypothetical protein n=1 Tax=Catenuloplanes japonicus TaxID=33876 RepID=UPI000525A550|nr:hypothetical protein [Catenuloplanes japonicus]